MFGAFSLAFITFTVILNASQGHRNGSHDGPVQRVRLVRAGGRATAAASATGLMVGAVAEAWAA